MTFTEFIFLDYITFRKKVTPADLTEHSLRGYLDYYYRIDMTQPEIDEALAGLAAQNCIHLTNGRYLPSDRILEIKRRSRKFPADFFNDRSRTRFRENIIAEFGTLK